MCVLLFMDTSVSFWEKALPINVQKQRIVSRGEGMPSLNSGPPRLTMNAAINHCLERANNSVVTHPSKTDCH